MLSKRTQEEVIHLLDKARLALLHDHDEPIFEGTSTHGKDTPHTRKLCKIESKITDALEDVRELEVKE